MRKGDVIKVKTNAELLNKLFGTNYNGWQKSVYDCEGIRVWMIYLDHKERNKWRNYKDGNLIVEENMAPVEEQCGLRSDTRSFVYRAVFSKHAGYFVFEGVYEYDKTKSSPQRLRYYTLVREEF